jgi:hypothetical protein
MHCEDAVAPDAGAGFNGVRPGKTALQHAIANETPITSGAEALIGADFLRPMRLSIPDRLFGQTA